MCRAGIDWMCRAGIDWKFGETVPRYGYNASAPRPRGPYDVGTPTVSWMQAKRHWQAHSKAGEERRATYRFCRSKTVDG
jgi:hypothetical protein